jgi:hypothetical protein
MRAAPGRAVSAPRLIARKSRQIGIASLVLTRKIVGPFESGRQWSRMTVNSALSHMGPAPF